MSLSSSSPLCVSVVVVVVVGDARVAGLCECRCRDSVVGKKYEELADGMSNVVLFVSSRRFKCVWTVFECRFVRVVTSDFLSSGQFAFSVCVSVVVVVVVGVVNVVALNDGCCGNC